MPFLGTSLDPGYPEGIEAQTRQVFHNLSAVLAGCGLGLEHVVQVRVFLTEFERDYDRMNQAYASYFPTGRRPARTCIGVTGLAKGAHRAFSPFMKGVRNMQETLQAMVAEVRAEAANIISLKLVSADPARPMPPADAGAHVDLLVGNISGAVIRCFGRRSPPLYPSLRENRRIT
jgi:enamine deaminase RidA (YjgF/YER057c/UK114 family)